MTGRRVLGAVALLALCPGFADGDETTDALLQQAAFAVVDRQFLVAARSLGDAAAHAHAEGLLHDERLVRDDIRRLVRRARVRGTLAGTPRPVSAADLIATVIGRLDAAQGRAYVSAHALSEQLLIDATTTGTPELVGVASQALERHARSPVSGEAARMWADYARGLLAVELHLADRGPPAAAVAPLESALAACVRHGWQEPGIFVGIELASVHLAVDRPVRAAAACRRIATLLGRVPDPSLVRVWDGLSRTRLPEAAEAVLAPLAGAKKAAVKEVRVLWGRGSGRIRTSEVRSKIGRAWNRLAADEPFVVVERGKREFALRHTFDERFAMTQPRRQGTFFLSGGGIHLCAHGQAVALERIDLAHARGTRSAGGARSRWRAWTYLAPGEAWSLSKSGRVVVSR